MTGQHDIGGLPAGPVDTGDTEPEPWQKMITAIYGAMVSRGHGNADMRYLVLPGRPAKTEDWSEEQLTKLVTRDSLVGATVQT